MERRRRRRRCNGEMEEKMMTSIYTCNGFDINEEKSIGLCNVGMFSQILIVWMLLRPRKGLRSDHDDISPRARVSLIFNITHHTQIIFQKQALLIPFLSGCDWGDFPILDLKTVML